MNHSDPTSITKRNSSKIYNERPERNCVAARKAWDMAVARQFNNPPISLHLKAGTWWVTHQDRTVSTIFHTSSLARKWTRKEDRASEGWGGLTTPAGE